MLRGVVVALLGLCLVKPVELAGSFAAWWNIPVQKCTNNGVLFDLDQFNIIHNTNNTNFGDKVNIYYRPGVFPYYDEEDQPINGGIPQQGNLTQHVSLFTQQLLDTEPQGFEGVSVLDFEKYLPAYNGYVPRVAREASKQWVRDRRPDWNESAVTQASAITFDVTVKPFFKTILKKNQELRPDALIGYYKYPPCNNWDHPYNACKDEILALNDELHGVIFNESTALFPSVYAFETHGDLYLDYLTTMLDETLRVNINGLPVYPYYWYKYHDPATAILTDEEAIVSLWTIKAYGMDGVVLWGSVEELRNAEDCLFFRDYVYSFLGPVLKCLDELPAEKVAEINAAYPLFGGPGAGAPPHLKTAYAVNRNRVANLLRTMCGLQ